MFLPLRIFSVRSWMWYSTGMRTLRSLVVFVVISWVKPGTLLAPNVPKPGLGRLVVQTWRTKGPPDSKASGPRLPHRREADREPRALAGRGVQEQLPPVRLDDALGQREPQAGALTLRREERLEQAPLHVLRDAGPVVRDLDDDL